MKRINLVLIPMMVFSVSIHGLSLQSGGEMIKLKVVAELANIRQKPDIGSLLISQLPQGALINASEKQGDWFKVSLKDSTGKTLAGFVHASLVDVLAGSLPRTVEPGKVDTEVLKKVSLTPPVEEEKEQPVPPVEKEKREPPEKEIITEESAKPFVLSQVDVYLSGGTGRFSLGDLNTGAQGLAAFYADFLGVDQKDGLGSLDMLLLFGGEVTLPVSSRISLGLGADYLSGKKAGSLSYMRGLDENVFAARPEVSALPVRAFILYHMFPHFYAKVGLEYYFAQSRYFYRLESDTFWQQWRGEARTQGLGAIGGFGLTFDLNSSLGLFMEVNGRYAEISGFEGTDRYEESTGLTAVENGKMYFYKAEVQGNKTFSLLYIRSRIPTEPGVAEPREAVVNFSGLSLKAGLRIRF
jgi:hypothetical protein